MTPLMLASTCGCTREVMKSLINNGNNINFQNKDGNAALHLAVAHSQHDTVVALLDAGADIHLPNAYGLTAIAIGCAESMSVPIIRTLIERGAQLTAKTHGNTPLMLAVESGYYPVVAMLLNYYYNKSYKRLRQHELEDKNEYDINAVNEHGNTALHKAAERGFHSIGMQEREVKQRRVERGESWREGAAKGQRRCCGFSMQVRFFLEKFSPQLAC